MPAALHTCCAGRILLHMPVQCQAVQTVLSSCNMTMMMIIVMMMIIGACGLVQYLSQANPAKPVGQFRGLRGGHARSNWEGHDRGLDGLSCRHKQLSQARNTKSHIGLASSCKH